MPTVAAPAWTADVWTPEDQATFFRAHPPRFLRSKDFFVSEWVSAEVFFETPDWLDRAVAYVAPTGCLAIVHQDDALLPCPLPVVHSFSPPEYRTAFCALHAHLGWCERACPWTPPPPPPPPPTPRPPRPRTRTPAERQAVAAAHRMGATLDALAAFHGVSRGRVHQIIGRADRETRQAVLRQEAAERARERARQAPWRQLGEVLRDVRQRGVTPDRLDRAHRALVLAETILGEHPVDLEPPAR